jgi:hypothetical protein
LLADLFCHSLRREPAVAIHKNVEIKKQTEKHLYRIMLGRLTQKLQPWKTRVLNYALGLAKVQYEVYYDKAKSASEKHPNQR